MTSQPLDYALPPHRRRGLRWLMSRFSRWHLWTALTLWLFFSGLTLWIVAENLDNASGRTYRIALTTAGTVLGPMTGAISRDFQGCCLDFSLALMPVCGGALFVALVVQLVVPPRGAWTRVCRVLAWTAGLFVWFGGGIVSFGHALS